MPLRCFVPILIGSLLLCGCIAQTPPPPSVHPDSVVESIQRYEQINARIANERRLIDVRVTRGDYMAAAGAQGRRPLGQSLQARGLRKHSSSVLWSHDQYVNQGTHLARQERGSNR